uniref:Putative salivary lipocalin n=1 Tax=Ixodes ricinus TaxID=34613 RepID=A0A0K8R2Y3_IXORI
MTTQLSTVFCIMAAAIIHLPEVHSKPNPEKKYDAWQELSTRFSERYYLTHRSHVVDVKLGGRARCVSVLKTTPVFGEHSINARITIKANRPTDVATNKDVKMTAYTPRGTGTEYMIKTMDQQTGELLYNQELTYTDRTSCRVLVYTADGDTHCQLWVHQTAASRVSRGCKDEYRKQCSAMYPVFQSECLNN